MIEATLGSIAQKYILEALSTGNTMALKLQDSLKLEEGNILSYVPEKNIPTSGQDFTTSILVTKYSQHDKIDGAVSAADIDKWLIEKIALFLKERETHVCIFENALIEPSYPIVKKWKARYAIFKKEIYHLLYSQSPIEQIKKLLTVSRATYPPLIGILTSWNDKLNLNQNPEFLDEEQINNLVKSTSSLIVGAYDGEGYLIWERRETSNGVASDSNHHRK